AFPELGDGFDVFGIRAALRTVLDYAVVLLLRGYEQFALVRIVTARFFDVDVLAGGDAQDCGGGVPVVGRSDGHGKDFLVVQDLLVLADGRGGGGVVVGGGFFGDDLGTGRGGGVIDVADVLDEDVGEAGESGGELGAAAAGAHDGDDDALAWRGGGCGLGEEGVGGGEGGG